MSKKLIEKLRKDRDEFKTAAETLLGKMETGEELTDGEKTTLAEARAEAIKLDERISDVSAWESQRLDQARREAELDGKYRDIQERVPTGQPEKKHTSLGAEFLASSQFLDYQERRAGTSGVFVSQFNIITSVDGTTKPLAGTTSVADAPMPYRSTPLLDAAMPIQVSTNEYEWIEYPLTAPMAGDVLEGAPKPEASIVPVVRRGSLGKAAHHIGVTEEALQDVTGLRSRIDTELLDGVRQKAEAKANAALIAATLPTATHDTLMKAIRVGVAQVQIAGFSPTSVVLNPLDYGDIDLELLNLTTRGAQANNPLWGLTIIPAGVVTQGTAYVGDIYRGMRKIFKSEAYIRSTDSHADEFVDNVYRILAEQRLSVHVVRPDAIVECTATPVIP
jgi:hypothetical protein